MDQPRPSQSPKSPLAPEASRETSERPAADLPRIYVGSLTDYNAGILHGAWLDADQTADELQAAVDEMLAASPTTRRYGEVVEEWAIHDYENFGAAALSEWERLSDVSALARGIARHGGAFAAWWSFDERAEDDLREADDRFEEAYRGEYSSVGAYGEQYLEDIGLDLDDVAAIPDHLRPYVSIDTEAFGRDMVIGGAIYTVESPSGVYVFDAE